MIEGYWVTLTNAGGVLDTSFAKTLVGVRDIIAEFSKHIQAGDTITVREGTTEG